MPIEHWSEEVAIGATFGAKDNGLKHEVLSAGETLAQSISTMAPTTSPAMTIPLVFALAGNGTWLAYVLATVGVLLMALCISRFARYSASPGSLYTYATSALPEAGSRTAGLALLLAYIATASSVVGGFINYGNVLFDSASGRHISPLLLAVIAVGASVYLAIRDIQVSARVMLWVEAVSVAFIVVVLALLLWRYGFHVEQSQAHLRGVSPSGVRLGVVLALFSFVGFESATTLGTEARNPLRTIPRAVIQSAVFAGMFLVLCAYAETLGFHTAGQDLGTSTAPMHVLAVLAGVKVLGLLIDMGAFVSMFACTLACITAAARVLLRMAQDGLVHRHLSRAHARNQTPHTAVIAVSVLTLLPVLGLSLRGVSGADIYGYMGSLATYGFIVVYGLVAVALPIYLKREQQLTMPTVVLSVVASVAMLAALGGTLYPVPARPYNWLPYLFLVYLLGGLAWFAAAGRRRAVGSSS